MHWKMAMIAFVAEILQELSSTESRFDIYRMREHLT